MKVKRAVALADELRPNMLDEELKVSFVYELEADIAEMMKKPIPENTWPRDDATLLLPFPYDNAYVLYLCAKIDNANEETSLYMNDMVAANTAISQVKAWWRRNNAPVESKDWKV